MKVMLLGPNHSTETCSNLSCLEADKPPSCAGGLPKFDSSGSVGKGGSAARPFEKWVPEGGCEFWDGQVDDEGLE